MNINHRCKDAVLDFIESKDFSLDSIFKFCDKFAEEFSVSFTQANNYLDQIAEDVVGRRYWWKG